MVQGDSKTADYTYTDIFQNEGIKFALDPVVFTSERHGEQFYYEVPLDGNGAYTFILQFVEVKLSLNVSSGFKIQIKEFLIFFLVIR